MTKKKDPNKLLPTGRPTEFRPEYAEQLVAWMAQGYSFGSFGSQIGMHRATMYRWLEDHPAFCDAYQRGQEALEKHYIDMGRAIATGQLKRLKSEKPMIGKNGKPVLDARGNVLMEREYEPAQGNAAAWIFLTKNLLGFKNENHHVHSLPAGARQPSASEELTPEERKKTILEMTKALQVIMETEENVIEVNSKQA